MSDTRTVKPRFSEAISGYTEPLSMDVGVYTDALSRAATFTFDMTAQTTQVVTADGTQTFSYDSNYDQTTSTDGLSRTTSTVYDAYGDPTSVTTPDGKTTTMTYDPTLHLLTSSEKIRWASSRRTPTRGPAIRKRSRTPPAQ